MKKRNLVRTLALVLILCLFLGTVSPAMAVQSGQDGHLFWEKMEDSKLLEQVNRNTQTVSKATEPRFAEDEKVRVFIVMDGKSALDTGYSTQAIAQNQEALSYARSLESQQDAVIQRICQQVLHGQDLQVNYHLSLIANAVTATVEYGQIPDISMVEGVEAVYLVPVYELAEAQPNTFTAGQMVGSTQTWSNGYTGAGSRVAIIDTGLDTDHPSFDSLAYLTSLEEAAQRAGKAVSDYALLDTQEITSVLESLNAYERYTDLTVENLYYSEKVPFGFNYVDYDLNITHDYDSQGDHGTHVAGIAAANRFVPIAQDDGTITYGPQSEGVAGMAPDAQLMIMKVFGAIGGAYSDDYMAAIEDAILLGADAVNLSLGSGSPGFTTDIYEGDNYVEEIFDKLVGSDTIVSISAGNSYSWGEYGEYGANFTADVNLATGGSPGTYANALTVASVNNSGYTGNAVEFEGGNLIHYNEVIDGTSGTYTNTPLADLDTNGTGTVYDYILIDSVGEEADYEGLDVTGKVVLVNRGTTSFYLKHMLAEAMGAKALFVINNTDGVINMDLSSSTATIPCVSLLQVEGESIKAGAHQETVGSKVVYTGQVIIYKEPVISNNHPTGWQISDFSSWGVPGDLSLKPEITAPGGNIYSTLTDGQYGIMSGTSMAAPGVTGISALVMQYIRENDLVEKTGLSARTLAQSLMMSTAQPLMEGGMEYSPRRQGAGLANALAATSSPSYILVGAAEGNDGKVKAELGDDPERTGVYSFEFTLYNMSESTQTYAFDASVLTEAVADELYIAESAYRLNPMVEFTVGKKSDLLAYDFQQDGDVDREDANAFLRWINQVEVDVSDLVRLSLYDFDVDGDYDTDDVYLYLCYIAGTRTDADMATTLTALAPGESQTVTVTITLSETDRAYLDTWFANGMYIDAFIYIDSQVQLSIPMLAFYGNWTDSSMYENWDFMAQEGYTYAYAYGNANYLTYVPNGSLEEFYLTPNLYAEDDAYIADRTAISSLSGDKIGNFCFNPIRNMANVSLEVVDAEYGTVYYEAPDLGATYGAYYYVNGQYWASTQFWATMNWSGTDLQGTPLPDGTKTLVRVTGTPEYYAKHPEKTPGKGVTLEIPLVIDNTAPEATKIAAVLDGNDISSLDVTVTDNRYVAAVYLLTSSGEVLDVSAVNQTECGQRTTINMDVSQIDKDIIYVAVVDYAGNETDYRVKISFVPDTEYADAVELSETSIRLLEGYTHTLSATVYPLDLLTVEGVTWSSSNESVATVDANGLVTGVRLGNATITATTVAEPHLTATCAVEVFQLPGVDLRGFVADDWNGNFLKSTAYWAEFNTNDLENYERTSGLLDQEFFSATVVGDKIYAGTRTHKGYTGYSDIYVIDPENDDEAELLYEKVRWLTDMTYLPSIYGGKIAGSYAYQLNLLDKETGKVVTLNLSDMIGKDYLLGVAYAFTEYDEESAVDVDYFYAITWTGQLYRMGLANDPADDTGLSFLLYGPEHLASIDFNSNSIWYFNSLYYDAETDYLFWSALDNDGFFSPDVSPVLYCIEPDGSACYKLKEFPKDVLAMCGLFKESDLTKASNSNAADLELSMRSQRIDAVPGELAAEVPQMPMQSTAAVDMVQ